MTSLITRLRTEGPSRELDAEIRLALGGWRLWRSKYGYWYADPDEGPSKTSCVDPFGPKFDHDTGKKNPDYDRRPLEWFAFETSTPEYTSNLQDAVGLVPEGMWWSVEHKINSASAAVGYNVAGRHPAHGSARDAAQALCIAALLARGWRE